MSPAARASRPTPIVPDLDLDAIESSPEPSCTFTLAGRQWHCRNANDLHWDTIEKYLIAQASNDGGQIAIVLDSFFTAVLYPEEIEDFMALKRDPSGPLGVERATQLIHHLNREVLGLPGPVDPTTRPANSGRGSRRSERGSKVEHDGRVTKTA